MINPGLAQQGALWANPQLAVLQMMHLMQSQQQPLHNQQNLPLPTETQVPLRQAKEKVYHDAQSEQLDRSLTLFLGAALSAGESKFAALEDMNDVRCQFWSSVSR